MCNGHYRKFNCMQICNVEKINIIYHLIIKPPPTKFLEYTGFTMDVYLSLCLSVEKWHLLDNSIFF